MLTAAATKVLSAVNTIAAALGLDADDEQDDASGAAGEEASAA